MKKSKKRNYGSFEFMPVHVTSKMVKLINGAPTAGILEDADILAHYSIMEFGRIELIDGSKAVLCQPLN